MRMAKTDQAARMHSSCCRNTSAQPYWGTHTYARINVYHWTMCSLNGAYIDRPLDNHVVISDSRKSWCQTLLLRHMKFDYFAQCTRRYSTCSVKSIHAYSAEASPNENVCAQPYQNDTVRICQCSDISAEKYREKRYRLPCAYNKYQKSDCTAN